MWQTCFRTSEFDRGCVGELSDRGDCGFWGDSGGCRHTPESCYYNLLHETAVSRA